MAAVFQAVRDADLDGTCTEATDYPGCEIVLCTDSPAQAKIIVLIGRRPGGASVQFIVRAFMNRKFDKHTQVFDRAELGVRRFAPLRISRDWLRHEIALAARAAMEMCEPEHQEKLRRAAIQQRRQEARRK